MMASDDLKTTNDDLDAMDLMETFKVTKLQRRTRAGGTWAQGTIGGHRFEALVFAEPPENPDYGIDSGCISKLWLQRLSDREVVANFDRGWDVRPTTPIAQQIVDLLAEGLADFIYDD